MRNVDGVGNMSFEKSYILTNKYSHSVKFIICLLCFNIFLASTNHVICMELSSKNNTKSHLQLYECNYPQNNEVIHQQINHEAPIASLTGLMGSGPPCPDCVDEHIQYVKSSAGLDLPPAVLLTTLLPVYQNYFSQSLLCARESLVQQQLLPLPYHRSAAIRSTVLLI